MIKTKRLYLRRECVDDAEGIRRLLSDPEGRIFTGGVINYSIDVMKEKIAENQSRFSIDYL